jgi:hypothetical protein
MPIEINVSIEELRKNKIFVATPMYGGMATGTFTKGCTDLARLATEYGMDIDFFFLFNESLIPRARNYLVDDFLRSKYTHFMFIDADIGFNPSDVIALSVIANQPDKDIVCAPYPKKCISWEKIKRAVDKGFADHNPASLENYVGDYVFNPTSQNTTIRLDEPVEVMEGGTGFMMIPRATFVKYAEAYPELSYRPDHIRTEHFDGSREITAFFDTVIDPATKRYLSEDYMFCQYAQRAGLKTWLCPWMQLTHTGSYTFGGSLIDLAQIGASATADVEALGKAKKLANAFKD